MPDAPSRLPDSVRDHLRQLPKAELHVHLEGSMRPARMLELTRKHFGGAPWETVAEVEDLFTYRDFEQFLSVFSRLAMALQQPDDFRLLAEDYFASAAEQGVVYAEMFISPALHIGRGLDVAGIVSAIGDARAAAREQYGLESGIIFDISRQLGQELAWEAARAAIGLQGEGVVGIGIGGNEPNYPPELFTEQFAAAKSEGLGLCAHAGEWAGPDSMRGAMDALGATRLGHGTAVREEDALLHEVRDRGIMLDMCPNSNLRTKSITRLADHPVTACLEAGVAISLNSDDPSLFQTSILGEYETLHVDFDVPMETLVRIAPEAMRWSFADEATRTRVQARMEAASADLV